MKTSKSTKLYEFRYIREDYKEKIEERIIIGYGRYKIPKLSRIYKRLKKECSHNCFDIFGYTEKTI